jgi:hypothetical protein
MREAADWLTVLLIPIEVLVGVWLISGRQSRAAWCVALSLFACFAGHSFVSGIRNETTCGCFGGAVVTPWIAFTIDLAAILLLCYTVPRSNRTAIAASVDETEASIVSPCCFRYDWRTMLLTLTGGVMIGSSTALVISDPSSSRNQNGAIDVIMQPSAWIGTRFPILEQIDIGQQIEHGRWIVVLYRYDCPTCQTLVAHYETSSLVWSSRETSARVALVEIPPYDAERSDVSRDTSRVLHGHVAADRDWVVTTPVEIELEDSIVTHVSQ